MFKLDFSDTYPPRQINKDYTVMVFVSEVVGGESVIIRSVISPHPDPQLNGVFNFGFGIENPDGSINDTIRIKHSNPDKLFSTVMLHAYFYVSTNPGRVLGIDGSNDARARLYHRMIKSNKDYLEEFFKIQGVDWYVRLMRSGKIERKENGDPFFKPRPEAFDHNRESYDLYRYYTFHLNENEGIDTIN